MTADTKETTGGGLSPSTSEIESEIKTASEKVIEIRGEVDLTAPILYFGHTQSPSVALAVRQALTEKAVQIRYPEFTEYVLSISEAIKTFLEQMKSCDCPICEAKRYVADKLGTEPTEEATQPQQQVPMGFKQGGGGHYL